MPAKRNSAQEPDETQVTETGDETQVTDKPDVSDKDGIITVNVAIAIKIDPEKWATKSVDVLEAITTRIMAEKGLDKDAARKRAEIIIESGLEDMVMPKNAGGANDVRREIREYVLTQSAILDRLTAAGATVELNEARRTNHKPKE